jgi:hypothetical protein
MGDMINRLSGGEFLGLVSIVGGCLVLAITIWIIFWAVVRMRELDTHLKQQMLEKGMSPADIEQVLRASRGSGKPVSDLMCSAAASGQPITSKAALVQMMAEHDMDGKDIERVLRALHDTPDVFKAGDSGPPDQVTAVARLLEQGMDAEDIARVVAAFHGPGFGPRDKALLVENMVEHGLDARDIERILLALPGRPRPAEPAPVEAR